MKFQFPEKLKPYEFRIILSAAGLVLGILLLTIGFWRTLLLAIIIGVGYVVGTYKDGQGQTLYAKAMQLIGRR